MRHRRKAKYFGVKTAHRKAMFRNMVTSLFRHGRITTTVPRAKELRRLADRLVTLAKDGSLHARRQVLSVINDKGVVAKLFSEIADQMASRNGGYTRIVKIGPRRGDGAMMCIIELVKESLKTRKSRPVKQKEEAAAPTVIPEAKEAPEEGEEAAESPEAATTEAEEEAEAKAAPETETAGAAEAPEEPATSGSDREAEEETGEAASAEESSVEDVEKADASTPEEEQEAETAQAPEGEEQAEAEVEENAASDGDLGKKE